MNRGILDVGAWILLLSNLGLRGMEARGEDSSPADRIEQAIGRLWSEHQSLSYQFTETRKKKEEGQIAIFEGSREIRRDGEVSRSRTESTEYFSYSIGSSDQKRELQRFLTVCDGVHRYRHILGSKTAARLPAEDCDHPVKRFRWLRERFDFEALPDESLQGEPVYVLVARRKGQSAKEWLLYYRKDGVLVKQVNFAPDGSTKATLECRDIRLDLDLPRDRFVFQAPPGVSIKDPDPPNAPGTDPQLNPSAPQAPSKP